MADPVELIRRRHPEWAEHHRRWAWLLDSLEGGERYREAIYGHDQYGYPVRNLVRHKREYPASLEGAAAAGRSRAGTINVGSPWAGSTRQVSRSRACA